MKIRIQFSGQYTSISGGIFPIDGTKFRAPELGPVAIMAVDDINNNPDILPDHRLMLDIQNGQCEADVVMKKFIDFIKNKDPSKFRSMVGILGKNNIWFSNKIFACRRPGDLQEKISRFNFRKIYGWRGMWRIK